MCTLADKHKYNRCLTIPFNSCDLLQTVGIQGVFMVRSVYGVYKTIHNSRTVTATRISIGGDHEPIDILDEPHPSERVTEGKLIVIKCEAPSSEEMFSKWRLIDEYYKKN